MAGLHGRAVRGEAVGFSRSALREHRRRVQLVAQDPDEQLFSADVMQDVSFGPLNLGLTDEEARARVDDWLLVDEGDIEH